MVWARAVWRRTSSVEGWLRLGEINDFTAAAVVAGVLQLLENDSLPVGVHTPATAFGADFILGLPGVERRVEPVIDAESRMGGANA
jgi:short subunit dehydrogenase-like uncharacterized protein